MKKTKETKPLSLMTSLKPSIIILKALKWTQNSLLPIATGHLFILNKKNILNLFLIQTRRSLLIATMQKRTIGEQKPTLL